MIFDSIRIDRRAFGAAALAALMLAVGCTQSHDPGERLYISNERGDSLVAIDPKAGTVVERLRLGQRPRGLLLSPDGTHLYVAVSGTPVPDPNPDQVASPPSDPAADGIVVLDLKSLKVERVLQVGRDPSTFALSPDGRTLYVANEDDGAVSAVAVDGSGKRLSVKVGKEPLGVAVTADGDRLFVACAGSNRLMMLNAHTLRPLGRLKLEGRPHGLLLSRDGSTLFVTIEDDGQLAFVSAEDGTLTKRIDIAREGDKLKAIGMAEGPDGHVFVTTGDDSMVAEIDPSPGKIVRLIDHVGDQPWGIALTADGQALVTANGSSNDVTVIDRVTGKILRKFHSGDGPWGVAGPALRQMTTSRLPLRD